MKTTPFAAMFLFALAAVASAAPATTVAATVRIDDTRATALAVNDLGQLVGYRAYSGTSTGTRPKTYQGWEGFITSADGASPLSVVPITGTGIAASGVCKGSVFTSALLAINASGTAAGESTVSIVDGTKTVYVQHAALYSDGTLTDLGSLSNAKYWSSATGINASGVVVGASEIAGRKTHAFLYDGLILKDLGTLGGAYSASTAINDAGTVVGGSTLLKSVIHPFSYAGTIMTDLGLPAGFGNASATAISSNGIIAGWGNAGRNVSSFVLTEGVYINLGSLYSTGRRPQPTPLRASGVNADGTVVGDTFDANGRPRAFICQGGVLSDLNAALPSAYAGWTVVSASGISDAGYISAIALDASKKQYALLLKLSSGS